MEILLKYTVLINGRKFSSWLAVLEVATYNYVRERYMKWGGCQIQADWKTVSVVNVYCIEVQVVALI